MPTEFLALVETASNQRYIFASNRLRDALGASYGLAQVEGWAKEEKKGKIVLETSGKAEYLFDNRETAKDWVEALTRKAGEQFPGMDLAGVVVEVKGGLDATRKAAYQELERVRGRMGGVLLTDRMLPWLEPCPASGLPAEDVENPHEALREQGQVVSKVVAAKRWIFKDARGSLKRKLVDFGVEAALAEKISDAREEDPDWRWMGVIHADGNRLGRLFLHFGKLAEKLGLSTQGLLQPFSDAVKQATWQAFAAAVTAYGVAIQRDRGDLKFISLYPLIVGGDDLSVICDGQYALLFANTYLKELEKVSENTKIEGHALTLGGVMKVWAEILKEEKAPSRLTACAGVAIVKPHFPVISAHDLAADLCGEAKKGLQREEVAGSAIAWHALMDASLTNWGEIKERLEVDFGSTKRHLSLQPYRISGGNPTLEELVGVARSFWGGPRPIPSSVLHDLRRDFFLGLEPEIRPRYRRGPQGGEKEGTALWQACCTLHRAGDKWWAPLSTTEKEKVQRTGLIDALDAHEFIKGFESTEGASS